jgi:two-component sensor histidine kinase
MSAPVAENSRQGLLRRMTLMCGALTALTIFIITPLFIYNQRRQTKLTLDTISRDLARHLIVDTMPDLIGGQSIFSTKPLSPVHSKISGLSLVSLIKNDGTIQSIVPGSAPLTTTNKDAMPTAIPDDGEGRWLDSTSDKPIYLYTQPVSLEKKAWGWIQLRIEAGHYLQPLSTLYTQAGLIAGSAFLLSALAAYFLSRNMIRPIKELQYFTQRIAAGSTNARLEINSGDELQDLAENLNQMVVSLSQSQEKLQKSLQEQTSLREKDILLREIHHRVKNNMQMLSSLMRLQARRATTAEAKHILNESESRIRSMGLIHEKLYQSDSLSIIEMPKYFKTLTDEIMRAGRIGGPKHTIQLSIGEIKLGFDTALPCGLIVTELVQNCLKYAFADGRQGTILVSMTRDPNGHITLVVWDNGIGLPPDFDPAKLTSLGTRLVRLLTDQLNGSIDVRNERGTRITINFHESQYQKRVESNKL